eukprot:IDg11603t1
MASDDGEIHEETRPSEEFLFYEDRKGQRRDALTRVLQAISPTQRGSDNSSGGQVIPGYGGALPYYGGFPGTAYIPGTLQYGMGTQNTALAASSNFGHGSLGASSAHPTGAIIPYGSIFPGAAISRCHPLGFGVTCMGIHPSIDTSQAAQVPLESSPVTSGSSSRRPAATDQLAGSSSIRTVLSSSATYSAIENREARTMPTIGTWYPAPSCFIILLGGYFDFIAPRSTSMVLGTSRRRSFKEFLDMSKIDPWLIEAVHQYPEQIRAYCMDDEFYPGGARISQDVVSSSFYQRNVCVSRDEFREKI